MAELLFDDWLDRYFEKDDTGFIDFYFIKNNKHYHLSFNDIEDLFESKLRDEKINKIIK